MSTPPPRISLSELWGHARIRDLLSITVKCKILKLSTKKCQGCFQAAHLPPPPKKKSLIRVWETDYSCIDSLHGPPFNKKQLVSQKCTNNTNKY